MSTEKTKGIPLATLLRPDPELPPLPPGQSGTFMQLVPNRNLHMLMGEKTSDAETTRLRRAITDELVAGAAKAGQFRKGRSTGLNREEERRRRERIRELGLLYPALSSRKLYQHADMRSLRDEGVTLSTFANILSKEAPRRRKRPT